MEGLKDIREKWYSAYKNGNVQELKKYESPNLTVKIGGKKEEGNRYLTIEENVRSNTWFQPELLRKEFYKEQETSCEVSGQAEVMEGKAKGTLILYHESWQLIDSNWQIEYLAINA